MLHRQFGRAPFARLLLPLMAGIIMRNFFQFPVWMFCSLTVLFFFSLLVIKWSGLAGHFIYGRSFALGVYGCLFFLGMALVNDIDAGPGEGAFRSGTICHAPDTTGDFYRFVLDHIYEYTDSEWSRLAGKAMVYLDGSADPSMLVPGQRILFFSELDTLSQPKNPMNFNARRFYHNRKIYWKTYLKKDQYRFLCGHDPGIRIAAERLRMKINGSLTGTGIHHPEIVAALLTGYRQGLDEEEKRVFAGSGLMHVLAVSGLHTGLIYGMAGLLFSFFFRKKRLIRLILPLPFVWLFAVITGLSPTVTRAALMITLFVMEACLNRPKNYFNVLFFSAFIMIVIHPGILFEPSFQLSFTAVFGIVSCFIPLYRRCRTGRIIVDRITGLLLVSACAQLFTFPLSTYYFHQFPVFFLLANLLAVPLVPLIMSAGLLCLVTQFLPAAAGLTQSILNLFSGALIHVVQWISKLPCSVLHDIYFRPVEVLLIYALILSVVAWLRSRQARFIFPVLAAGILLTGIDLHDQLLRHSHKIMHVYYNRTGWVCDVVDGKSHLILYGDGFHEIRDPFFNSQQTYWLSLGLRKHTWLDMENISRYNDHHIRICRSSMIGGLIILNFRSCSVGILSSCPGEIIHAGHLLKLEYLILCGEGKFNPDRVLDCIEPETIIISSNVSYSQSGSWERICHERDIPVHSVYKKGCFVIELR